MQQKRKYNKRFETLKRLAHNGTA